MYCQNCGSKLNEGVLFCAECGQKTASKSNQKKIKYSSSLADIKNGQSPLKTLIIVLAIIVVVISVAAIIISLRDTSEGSGHSFDSALNGYQSSSDFEIEGTWKSTDGKIGQVQSNGTVVVFDGANCNLISPRDTYALYQDNSHYYLNTTTILGDTNTLSVEIYSNDEIKLSSSSYYVQLERVK